MLMGRLVRLSEEEKRKTSEMQGKILFWILEGRHVGYMAEQLKLYPMQVEEGIDEALYILRQQVGIIRYIKILFRR